MGILFRYLVFGAALFSAFKIPSIDFVGACVGLFGVRMALFLNHVILHRPEPPELEAGVVPEAEAAPVSEAGADDSELPGYCRAVDFKIGSIEWT